jgi:sialate O-acetylesterase
MYMARGEEDNKSWPLIRLAQEQVYQNMRATGLAVLIDCGEFDNVHPKDKKTVGYRLFLQALKVVYHKEVQADSPRALSARRSGNVMIITLSDPVQFNGAATLFELAGEDGNFLSAQVQAKGTTLTLSAEGIAEPTAARYAWVNYGIVHGFGAQGLPLVAFIFP